MDYFTENWGSIVGILGFIASVGGLVYALLARRAAKSAEQAAREARQAVARTLSSIDVERAVALISRLKEIHHQRNWDYALGLYQDLRRTLSQISASIPEDLVQHRGFVNRAIPQVTAMENLVRRSRYENGHPEDISSLDDALSELQQALETLQGSMMYPEECGSD